LNRVILSALIKCGDRNGQIVMAEMPKKSFTKSTYFILEKKLLHINIYMSFAKFIFKSLILLMQFI